MQSRLLKMLFAVLALSLFAAACGSDSSTPSDEEGSGDEGSEETASDASCDVADLPLFAEGRLTIATAEPAFPPWVENDDPASGEGFEAAVGFALAEEMGFAADAVDWVRTDFDVAIAPGDKDYDFNMQQYSPTAERDEIVDFSVPYYTSERSVLALSSSPVVGAGTIADLAAGKWGATIGTTDLDYIEETIGAEVAVFDTQADVVAAMEAGQIDATVVALPSALYLSAAVMDDATVAGVLPDSSESNDDNLAALFTDGSELKTCVDIAIESMRDGGTLDSLAEEWLQGGGDAIPSITE